MKHRGEHTAPALLSALDKLLAVLNLMRTHDLAELVAQAKRVRPNIFNSA
ncbi:hypothetical protein GobsT_13700 [Gemmata obscuriglobus]|nr:hypothetical protein [Gemmata obscuriglobus]QEG26627.1 hypothetical protein GobsT_13700 [Gemmata obscuriglobus]VTS02170.1 unnamed protein product [Gemmata obscuriglobus UQM 2246]